MNIFAIAGLTCEIKYTMREENEREIFFRGLKTFPLRKKD